MLILTRKTDEEITIEGGITIKVCRIRGDKVQIGIDAPAHLHVGRAECNDRARRPRNDTPEQHS